MHLCTITIIIVIILVSYNFNIAIVNFSHNELICIYSKARCPLSGPLLRR